VHRCHKNGIGQTCSFPCCESGVFNEFSKKELAQVGAEKVAKMPAAVSFS
jgi:hypothetical protein